MNAATPTPLRVLLVEDNPHDQIAFMRAFRDANPPAEITVCERAQQALEQLEDADGAFDVLVTDHQLPGLSGLELCREVLRRGHPLPLVLLTGAGDEYLAVEALKAGVADYLIKDPEHGYLALLPVVLPKVVQHAQDRQARQRAEQEKATILDSMAEMMLYLDPDLRIRWVNQAAARALNLPAEACAGRMCYEVWHQHDRFCDNCPVKRALETGEPEEAEVHLRDGRTLLMRGYPVRDESGTITGAVEVGLDITERERVEETLRQERDLVARIMETSPAGIAVTDSEGQITFANPRAESVLGLTHDEITERTYNAPAWKITDDEGGPFPDEELPFVQIKATRKPVYNVRHAITWPGGRRILLSINAAPMMNKSGQFSGMVATIENVTERARAEVALRDSERRYRELYENSLDGIVSTDLEGHFLECNPAYERILGYNIEELRQMNYLELTPKVWHAWEAELVEKQVIGRGYSDLYEKEYRRKDGTVFPVELRVFLQRDEDGTPIGMWGIARDITERQRTENALRRGQEHFRLLNQVGQQLTATLDLQQIAERLLLAACDVIHAEGASVWLWDPAEEGCLQSLALALNHRLQTIDLILCPGQGIAGWVAQHNESAIVQAPEQDARFYPGVDDALQHKTHSLLAVPLRIQGKVIGALEVINKHKGNFDAEDLTLVETLAASAAIAIENARLHQEQQHYAGQLEQRVAERTAELQTQYAQLDAILRNTVDGIVVVDHEGNIGITNPAAHAWLNQTLSVEDAERLRQAILELAARARASNPAPPQQTGPGVARERITTMALELIGLDFELSAALVRENGNEGQAAVVVNLHDVSHLKALNRMKTRFISDISHELRTPITAIKLYAHLMSQRPEQWRTYLDALTQEAEHQADLVQDILEISRYDAGRVAITPHPTPLNALVATLVDEYDDLAHKRGLTLDHQLAEDGPVALIDAQRVEQALHRLVDNAVTYTQEGGSVTLSTATQAASGRTWGTVTVADTGIGIPAEERAHIFERFFRGKEPQLMHSGTGLGLSIAQEIVQLHGGHITAESVEAQGATFTIWLPLAEAPA